MTSPRVVTPTLLRDWPLPEIHDDAGKKTRGTVVVIGGATDTPGAVLLAGLAALRVGAGRLTLATAAANAAALAVAVPEAAVVGLPTTAAGALGADAAEACADLLDDADALVLGPGLRSPDDARTLVHGVLDRVTTDTTVVIDALACTCGGIATDHDLRLIATPNRTEAGYLLDSDAPDDDQEAARVLAEKLNGVVALHSTIADDAGTTWTDESGNSGLGTSGSGDVLAGAIGGLAARGASPAQAAVWGVHLHAQAGDRLAARIGRLGYLARELLDELPFVLGQLER
jgi:hydroxyethylthiazole kinase-like uncharacterized protein yjeF